MEEQETYPVEMLFEDLPISLLELGKRANINEVTLARVRDGKPTRRATANKLLLEFSAIYGLKFNLRNVTGINVQVNKRMEKKEAIA
jgi:hypothetical protein